VGIGETSAWLTEGSRELIPETRGSILEEFDNADRTAGHLQSCTDSRPKIERGK